MLPGSMPHPPATRARGCCLLGNARSGLSAAGTCTDFILRRERGVEEVLHDDHANNDFHVTRWLAAIRLCPHLPGCSAR